MTSVSELAFHQGEALFAVAQTYPTLRLCLVEAVQNSVDADATTVYVGVDLVEKRVVVCDNGVGVTEERLETALKSICKGVKSRDAAGRFGRGFIAPIHLARAMVFLSRPEGARFVNSWTFIGASLRRMETKLEVPFERLSSFPRLPVPFSSAKKDAESLGCDAQWRTMLQLDKITKDETITSFDPKELAQHIRIKLGQWMRRKGTTVILKVRGFKGEESLLKIDPTDYTGEPLEPMVLRHNTAGKIELKLYRAHLERGKRQGQVVVMQEGDAYPVTMNELRVQAMGAKWYNSEMPELKEGIDALCSGHFEGVITAENIELAPERNKFAVDDALTDVYVAIADWYDKVGRHIIHDERVEREEQRYQKLGGESLAWLMEELSNNPSLASLARNLRGVLPAAPAESPKPADEPRSKEKSERRQRDSSQSRRVVVRSPNKPSQQSRGRGVGFLSYAYELLKGSVRLWEYDPPSGVLTLNIRHPLWTKVDQTNGKHTAKNDRQIKHLQEWLALQLLMLLAKMLAKGIDLAELELHRGDIDAQVGPYVEMFILRR